MNNSNIAVLIVTYGDRSIFLERVVNRIRQINCGHLIIVDNGSVGGSAEYLDQLQQQNNISVLKNYDNLGSSGGISIGMLYYLTLGIDYLWILDDDNLPEYDALARILEHTHTIDTSICALHSLRVDASGKVGAHRNIEHSTFFEFSLTDIYRRLENKFLGDKIHKQQNMKLKYAPYGGLFLSANLIHSIGLPNKDMYLYVDDTEYTWRITSQGGGIFLIPESRIVDIDQNWSTVYPKPRFFNQFLFEDQFFRSYYSLRNHAYFDRTFWMRNKFEFFVNKYIFILILFILSIYHRKMNRFFLIIKTINDGEKGLLGRVH